MYSNVNSNTHTTLGCKLSLRRKEETSRCKMVKVRREYFLHEHRLALRAQTLTLEHRYPALRNGKIVSMPRDVRLQVCPSITIGHIRPSTRDLWRHHRKIVVAKGLTTNILDEEIQFYGMMILYCTKRNSMITVPPSFA